MSSAYRPARPRARLAVGGLALWAVAAVLLIGAMATRLSIVGNALAGIPVSDADAVASDNFVRAAAWLTVGAYVVAAVVFLMWLHRIVANNRALGAGYARFSPGFAVGCWFIPFANLVLPVQAMSEAWRGADPSSAVFTGRPSHLTPLIPAWWTAFLLGNIVARVASLGSRSGSDLAASLQQEAYLTIASQFVLLVAAGVAAALVLRLTERQEQRRAANQHAVAAGLIPPPAPPAAAFPPPVQ